MIFRCSQIYYCFIFIKIRISKEMHFQLYIPRYVNVMYVIVYIDTVYTVFTTISIAVLIKFFCASSVACICGQSLFEGGNLLRNLRLVTVQHGG